MVEYVSIDMIDVPNSIILNPYLSNIVLKSGMDWLSVPIHPLNRYGWSQKNKQDTQGIVQDLQVTGALPSWTQEAEREVIKMQTKEFVLRIKDRNGKKIILGRLDSPLSFDWIYNSGTQNSQLNAMSINWKGRAGRTLATAR